MNKTNRVIFKILMMLTLVVAGANAMDYIYAANAANAVTTDCGELDANGLCMAANIASSATVTISGLVDGKAEIEVIPSSAGRLSYKDITVTAYTNSALGYNIAAVIDNGQENKTTLVHESGDTSKVIPTITSQISAADFEAPVSPDGARNRWGISVDGGAYQPVTANMSLKSATGTTGSTGAATNIRLGARVDLESGFSGKYSTTLNFVVTANVAP